MNWNRIFSWKEKKINMTTNKNTCTIYIEMISFDWDAFSYRLFNQTQQHDRSVAGNQPDVSRVSKDGGSPAVRRRGQTDDLEQHDGKQSGPKADEWSLGAAGSGHSATSGITAAHADWYSLSGKIIA